MISLISTEENKTNPIKLNVDFSEQSNSWTIETNIDSVEYFIEDFVFNPLINTPKSVWKMSEYSEITHKLTNSSLVITIILDYLDIKPIVFELKKKMIISEPPLEGSVFLEIVNGKLEVYKLFCQNSDRKYDFDDKVLNSFKSVNIESLNYISKTFRDRISEVSHQNIEKSIEEIINITNIYDLWNIINNLWIYTSKNEQWVDENGYKIYIHKFKIFFKIPGYSYYCPGFQLESDCGISYFRQYEDYVTDEWYIQDLNGEENCIKVPNEKESVFLKIKFAGVKVENVKDICLYTKNLKSVHGEIVKYDIFGTLYKEPKQVWYIYI